MTRHPVAFIVVVPFAAGLLATPLPARGDDVPVIATYEMSKARTDARIAARDPRAFWIRQILARIESVSPKRPRGVKDPLRVKLSFVVARDGRLVSKAVDTSSGNAAADRMAIGMLVRAQPFPAMPAAMSDAQMSFTLPVRFR